MIKTLLFDLGGVLVPFDFRRAYAAIEPCCPYKGDELPRRIRSTDLFTRFESGLLEPEEFFRLLSSHVELNMPYSRFCDIWSGIFLDYELVPERLLAALHKRYRLIALSNTNALHFPRVRQTHPILNHFDDYVLSYEVKALKPAARIYEEAIARARCRAEECFFTDDIPAYVEAARALGIDAVPFVSGEQLEGELRLRGVEW